MREDGRQIGKKENTIRNVYSFEYTRIPKAFITPHHGG
jgi:hypothetical protein